MPCCCAATSGDDIGFKSHVEFRSDRFPANPGEAEQINPGRWGKRLADFLHRELKTRGIAVGDVYPEDWGWAIPIENEGFPLWIGCGNYEEDPDRFLVFVEPSEPVIRKRFRKINTTQAVSPVVAALDEILREAEGVYDVKWWTKE